MSKITVTIIPYDTKDTPLVERALRIAKKLQGEFVVQVNMSHHHIKRRIENESKGVSFVVDRQTLDDDTISFYYPVNSHIRTPVSELPCMLRKMAACTCK